LAKPEPDNAANAGRPFLWHTRVYYQHTDAGGIVFHGNYLNFMECARTELLQSRGLDLGEMARRDRVLFVVHRAALTYHRPALLNDMLSVSAAVSRAGRVRIEFAQQVRRADELLAEGELTLACVSADTLKPVGLPAAVRRMFEGNA
jgi:tol-pal system-associated acyl-CoA thioesterase